MSLQDIWEYVDGKYVPCWELHTLALGEEFTDDGEEGDDAGGVRKEFFLLLLKEILRPEYGMFKEFEETNTIWFHPNAWEDIGYFFMIGVLCGLAIYNFTIINLPFPLALYKKLLSEDGASSNVNTIEDIQDLSPTLAKV